LQRRWSDALPFPLTVATVWTILIVQTTFRPLTSGKRFPTSGHDFDPTKSKSTVNFECPVSFDSNNYYSQLKFKVTYCIFQLWPFLEPYYLLLMSKLLSHIDFWIRSSSHGPSPTLRRVVHREISVKDVLFIVSMNMNIEASFF
jgi:hypothetical protein